MNQIGHFSRFTAFLILWSAACLWGCSGSDQAPDPWVLIDDGGGSDGNTADGISASDVQGAKDGTGKDSPILPPEPGEFGFPCTNNSECFSGFCVPSSNGFVCTQTCVDTCPPGWGCQFFQLGGQDPVFLCLETAGRLCNPCNGDADCKDEGLELSNNRCISFGTEEGSFCGISCENDAGCPALYECTELEVGEGREILRQCLPSNGACECNLFAVQNQASTQCYTASEFGACAGTRSCNSEGLSDCDAAEPSNEVCDGADNDCNGVIDDGIELVVCTAEGELGVCDGFIQCVDGESICDAYVPSDEVCDGIDNDCNGGTDEGSLDTDLDGTADCVDADDDDDGHNDDVDNCPLTQNPSQLDSDLDNLGDACDPDDDNDEVLDESDNCPQDANPDQANNDDDPEGDACDIDNDNDDVFDVADNCPDDYNPDQSDIDADDKGDVCDGDDDADGIADPNDNCPNNPNQDQNDEDEDGEGDVCDTDDDGDGIPDVVDNCPMVANEDQLNTDGDAQGNLCDSDDDNDLKPDLIDNCPVHENSDQSDIDGDNTGDICDEDMDGDEVDNPEDNCPQNSNPDQDDNEGDGIGDLCDSDDDNDFTVDGLDNCPLVANPDQEDLDGNGQGNLCDSDMDGDGDSNDVDNCPLVPNSSQDDYDLDGIGDPCDPDKDGDNVANDLDNCPWVPNGDQDDNESDGQGDACDPDDDNDFVPDALDNCDFVANPDQLDYPDFDGIGSICDPDDDNDGADDVDDNCPVLSNAGQDDWDGDGLGDLCDPDDDNDIDPDITDCSQFNPNVSHYAPEICNGMDDNCVGGVDEEGASGCDTWYYDADGDGYGANSPPVSVAQTRCFCDATGLYRATQAGDCVDGSADVNPGAIEVCNGFDDNCDGLTDPVGSQGGTLFYKDIDGDNFGNSSDSEMLCSPSGKYTATQGGDCNDNNASIKPSAAEVCNGVDDNCDSAVDPDGSSGCSLRYIDSDGDGYGGGASVCRCSVAAPYTATNASDCCDSDNRVKPGQASYYTSSSNCGTWDYNCNGAIEKHWGSGGGGCGGWPSCSDHVGWQGSVANCGQHKTYVTGCSLSGFPWTSCDEHKSGRTQKCR